MTNLEIMKKKFGIGLVIGRFQPFHLGHKYLIEKALELCEEIIIVVCGPEMKNDNNPYNYEERLQMLEKFLEKEGYKSRVKKIFRSVDIPDDYAWRDLILKKTGRVDVVIGNNDEWSNSFFEEAGIPVVRTGLYRRHLLEGTRIRDNIKNKRPWKTRVPKYLHEHIK